MNYLLGQAENKLPGSWVAKIIGPVIKFILNLTAIGSIPYVNKKVDDWVKYQELKPWQLYNIIINEYSSAEYNDVNKMKTSNYSFEMDNFLKSYPLDILIDPRIFIDIINSTKSIELETGSNFSISSYFYWIIGGPCLIALLNFKYDDDNWNAILRFNRKNGSLKDEPSGMEYYLIGLLKKFILKVDNKAGYDEGQTWVEAYNLLKYIISFIAYSWRGVIKLGYNYSSLNPQLIASLSCIKTDILENKEKGLLYFIPGGTPEYKWKNNNPKNNPINYLEINPIMIPYSDQLIWNNWLNEGLQVPQKLAESSTIDHRLFWDYTLGILLWKLFINNLFLICSQMTPRVGLLTKYLMQTDPIFRQKKEKEIIDILRRKNGKTPEKNGEDIQSKTETEKNNKLTTALLLGGLGFLTYYILKKK